MTESEEAHRGSARANLDRSLVHGVAWASIVRVISQLAAWTVTIVVARILRPTDYGIVASASVFLGLIRLLSEFGLGTAIVAMKALDTDQVRQLGGFAAIMGGIACISMVLLASPISTWIGVPELRQIIPVLGVSTALSILSAVPAALLQKRLAFRRLSFLELIRALAAAGSMLALARSGAGYWSLVGSEVIGVAVYTFALLLSAPVRPAIPSFRTIAAPLKFSFHVIVGRIGWYTYSTADSLAISKRLGAAVVGDYAMAFTLTELPAQKVTSLILGIMPGVFSSVRDRPEEMRRYLMRITELLALVLFPASVGVALVAPDLVPLVLGPQWDRTVPVVRALAFFVTVRSVMPMFAQVLIARQKARVVMWFAVSGAIVLPPLFYLATYRGPVAVALVWSTCFPLLAFLQARAAYREIGISTNTMLRLLAPPAMATLVMSAVVLFTQHVSAGTSPSTRLALCVAVGAATYTILAWVTMRSTISALLARLSEGRVVLGQDSNV